MKIDVLRAFFRLYLKNKTMSSDKIDMSSVNNILVMSNTAIGDTLFATSSLRLIKERYPDKKIIILLNPKNYKLFKTNPYHDNIELFNGKWKIGSIPELWDGKAAKRIVESIIKLF